MGKEMGKSKKRFEITHKMAARITYKRHNSYNTRSNKVRQVRTPGGRLVVQNVQKRASHPGNAMATSSMKLAGLRAMRPHAYKKASKNSRRISRAYGGVYTHIELKNRIIRTFLTEEVKNVKKTMALAASLESKKSKKAKGAKGGQKKRQVKKPVANKNE